MKDLDGSELTSAVRRSFENTSEPRLRDVLDSLIRHLHAFVREVEPSIEEWEAGIRFLTRTGQKCDSVRQEFILLSDVLGVSMLVETINDAETPDATDSTVLGPFHMTESPQRALGDEISSGSAGEPCLVRGRVLDTAGHPLPGSVIDVWQANAEGFYDVQQPESQAAGNGRGLFVADAQGEFWFTTIVPAHYPIPTDGPVGELLAAARRHPYRPAHIHFLVTADEHEELTTHIFVAGSPYIEEDAVFAVKGSLVKEFSWSEDRDGARRYGVPTGFPERFRLAEIDLVLSPLPATVDPGGDLD